MDIVHPRDFEVYDARYFDTRKKGYLKCKSAFSARLDPFVGIWKNNIPIKGFYTEVDECTIDNIVNYLNGLDEEDFSEDNSNGWCECRDFIRGKD